MKKILFTLTVLLLLLCLKEVLFILFTHGFQLNIDGKGSLTGSITLLVILCSFIVLAWPGIPQKKEKRNKV